MEYQKEYSINPNDENYSEKIASCNSGDKYYKVSLLVRIPKEKFEEWDSHCDEIFHLLDNIDSTDMYAYENVTEEFYKEHILDIFTPGGGI